MKKTGLMLLIIIMCTVCLFGCGRIVDGPGMVNTEYEQGY